MVSYYCHMCGPALWPGGSPANLIATSYQWGKFLKHTLGGSNFGLNSVFDDPSYSTYCNYFVNTSASGYHEIDDQGRHNLIWFAGSRVGAQYRNSIFVAPEDGVKLVKPWDINKVHCFAISGSPGRIEYCARCGVPLPLW